MIAHLRGKMAGAYNARHSFISIGSVCSAVEMIFFGGERFVWFSPNNPRVHVATYSELLCFIWSQYKIQKKIQGCYINIYYAIAIGVDEIIRTLVKYKKNRSNMELML